MNEEQRKGEIRLTDAVEVMRELPIDSQIKIAKAMQHRMAFINRLGGAVKEAVVTDD